MNEREGWTEYHDLQSKIRNLLERLYNIGSKIGLSDEEIYEDIKTEILAEVCR